MNTRIAQALAAGLVLAVGASALFYQASSRCDVRCVMAASDGGGYRTARLVVDECNVRAADGGEDIDLVEKLREREPDGWDLLHCRAVGTTQDGAGQSTVSHECFCRATAGGSCRGSDNQELPARTTAGPPLNAPYDSATGAGCLRTPCFEFQGRRAMNPGCL